MDVDFFAGFDMISLEKERAMRLPYQEIRHLLRYFDLKIAHKT